MTFVSTYVKAIPQMKDGMMNKCCSICAICASADYTVCFGRASEYLSASSQYLRTFIPRFYLCFNNLGDLVFDGVELSGFKSRANASLLTYAARSIFVFYFFFFFLLIGFVGLKSSD